MLHAQEKHHICLHSFFKVLVLQLVATTNQLAQYVVPHKYSRQDNRDNTVPLKTDSLLQVVDKYAQPQPGYLISWPSKAVYSISVAEHQSSKKRKCPLGHAAHTSSLNAQLDVDYLGSQGDSPCTRQFPRQWLKQIPSHLSHVDCNTLHKQVCMNRQLHYQCSPTAG